MTRCIGTKGFTLIEVVVSAVILGIVALIGIIQVRSLSSSRTLENGLDDTRSFFVLARSYAQTGHLCCTTQLPNGYGIIITLTGTTASLYADLDSSNTYTAGTDQIISTITLPSGLNYSQCTYGSTIKTSGTCDLFFLGDNVSAIYAAGAVVSGAYTLTLQHAATAATSTLTVNSFGVIE